jgi:hypothetical protein
MHREGAENAKECLDFRHNAHREGATGTALFMGLNTENLYGMPLKESS